MFAGNNRYLGLDPLLYCHDPGARFFPVMVYSLFPDPFQKPCDDSYFYRKSVSDILL